MQQSLVAGVYEQSIDRESAFEKLRSRAATAGAAPKAQPAPEGGSAWGGTNEILFGRTGPRGGHHPGIVDAFAKSAARSVGSTIAREITRGIFGSLLGGKRR
jgi:hypothetical protein